MTQKKPAKAQTSLQLSVKEAPPVADGQPPSVPQSAPPAQQQPEAEKRPATPAQMLTYYMQPYMKQVLPDLLKKHNIEPSQFVHIVISEVKKNQKLMDAFMVNPSSLFASIIAGAEIGLIPSDMLGEFYLIPRNIKQENGSYLPTVTPLIGYKGIHSIIMRSGQVTKVHTECVFEGDEFEPIYGLEPNIIHKPNFSLPRTSKTLKFVYAVAKLKSGEYQFAVLSKADIIKITNLSKYNNELYFNDVKDPNFWMVRKTALIQLSKLLPKDYYGKKAIEMDGRLEGGAYLSLDENNNVKIIDGKTVAGAKQASAINTFNSLPDIPE